MLIGKVVDSAGAPVAGALVRAGRSIFGNGTSSTGRGGPPQARNTKETKSDEGGAFAIRGLPPSDVSIVAEHDVSGRSPALLIQNGGAPLTTMRVELKPFGSLEGTVIKAGQPAPDVRISLVPGVAGRDLGGCVRC